MSVETRRLIRAGFGFIEDELRLQRAVHKELLRRLDVLINMSGGQDAKVQAIREDIGALQERSGDHGRDIAALKRAAG